ncbi:DUF6308 family protein [Ornithinimicrobium cryptoxanthini]|uniref:DUF6308 family protein n=1 Tax=Ornithinimicrobium cryptoxanthini TaxID=2934161 RepID=A0ABY4YF19_9MICO|nr:DUF6308 family protein [Ornithinimicrobium cryptoxanthini]USQ75354.1 DUF6308 family protein [Ornithinimicrobium cryptoxanthini]
MSDWDRASVPPEWPTVSSQVLSRARERALQAIHGTDKASAAERLSVFYDVSTNYAGATFAGLTPNELGDITSTDLHATSLLSVEVGPQATRRLLTSGTARDQTLRALRAVPDVELELANAETFLAMESLYSTVKAALSSSSSKSSNPWVTTSKLCARKRPALFPVRDRNVCGLLGILGLSDFRADWAVFQYLVQDPDVVAAIDELPGLVALAGAGRPVELDRQRLRLLDAALWTCTVW